MRALSLIDALALLAYVAVIAAVTWRVRHRQKSTEAYFTAKRGLPGWAVAFSILGTLVSSVSFVAFPGAAFSQGWRLLATNLMIPLVLIFVALVVVPFYRRTIRMSSYEYLEMRFGLPARLYGSFGFVVLRTVDLGFTLLLTAIAAEVITGWPIHLVIVGIGLLTVLYTLLGGIEAVVWNDVIQGCVLGSGALLIFFVLLSKPAASPLELIGAAAANGRFSLGDFSIGWDTLSGKSPTFWMLALAGIAHFGRSYLVEQNMVQRYLLARSDREARMATIASAALCLAVWTLFMTIGSLLWSFYHVGTSELPRKILERPDDILPYFVATELPAGTTGLILAAIFAAAMQSFGSDLNSVATVATNDYLARFRPSTSDRQRLQFARCAVAVTGGMAVAIALRLTEARSRALYEVIITWGMILASGILGLFLLGFLSRRANRFGAYCGMAVCVAFVGWATLTGPMQAVLPVNFTWHPLMIGVMSHLVLLGTGLLFSLLKPPSLEETP